MENNSIPIDTLALMFGIGFIGVLGHWAKAAMRKQASWNLLRYLFVESKGASGSMFAAYIASMWALYSVGAFDIVKWEYVTEAWGNGVLFKPFLHAAIETMTAGYISDSAFNKAAPPAQDRRAVYVEADK